MAKKPPVIAAEEIAAWLSPSAALEMLRSLDRRTAKLAILNRLQHGLIRSGAQTATFQGQSYIRVPLDPDMWENAESGIVVSALWQTGDITIQMPITSPAYGRQSFPLALFDVRFDPVGIKALMPGAESVAMQQPNSESPQTNEPETQKGPSVSDEHLRAWFELYQKAYQGSQDTLANAHQSAVGMFPGKFVSRERVRQLCAGRKPGRKAKES